MKLAQIAPASRSDVGGCIQKCMQRVQQLQASDLRALTDGLATLRWRDENTWKEIGSVVTQKVEEIKVAELVKLTGAFSVATQRSTEMLTAVVGRVKESPNSLKCSSLASLVLSLQRAKARQDPQLLQAAANAMLSDFSALKQLKTVYIIGFGNASLSATFFHSRMFQILAQVLVERMPSLTPHDLSRVALAWGQAACKDDAFLQSLCKAIRDSLPSFPTNRISYTLHGLSLLGCQDKQLLVDLAAAWTTKGPQKPIEVLHVLCSLAKAGALDSSLCNHIAACSLDCVPQLSARGTAAILHACCQARCTHVEFLEALGKAASMQISEFSAKDLCEVSFAGVKLSLAPILGTSVPTAVLERLSDFNGSQLALMMYSMSRLSNGPGEHLPALECAALQHVSSLKPVDLRYICMAWEKVGVSDENLMDAVAAHAVEMIDHLDPSTVSHIAWAYAELQVTNLILFKALGVRCAQTVSTFASPHLGYTAFAFVRAGFHDDVPLISIARMALRRLGSMFPMTASCLARAFIRADVESPDITALLEGLAAVACQKGWTGLKANRVYEWTDFEKQSAETVQEFLPSILLNQRHQMGPVLSMALQQADGTVVNLEVDPVDLELSNLDRVVKDRRDDFLQNLGVEVLRLKVKTQDDLRYHLLQIFGNPVVPCLADKPEELEGPLEDLNSPSLCEHLWIENESGSLQHENLL